MYKNLKKGMSHVKLGVRTRRIKKRTSTQRKHAYTKHIKHRAGFLNISGSSESEPGLSTAERKYWADYRRAHRVKFRQQLKDREEKRKQEEEKRKEEEAKLKKKQQEEKLRKKEERIRKKHSKELKAEAKRLKEQLGKIDEMMYAIAKEEELEWPFPPGKTHTHRLEAARRRKKEKAMKTNVKLGGSSNLMKRKTKKQ